MPKCPKCGSTNIHADKKGFSVKKSLVGGFLFGKVGLLGGAVGSNKIRLTCLDCGYEFKPGEKSPDDFMANYTPVLTDEIPEQHSIRSKGTTEQKVRIETLLKYRDVIKEAKVALLEALSSEGHIFVIVPNGEIECLIKLQKGNSPIKRIVSFREYTEK